MKPIGILAVSVTFARSGGGQTGQRQESREEKIYRLHPEPLTEVREWLAYHEQFRENKLSMLKHLAEMRAGGTEQGVKGIHPASVRD